MCKISVVTSVYNCEKYIAQTIESVINQTFTDWEFILINDCSRDNSARIIEKFDDKRIRFFDNKYNQGQCANLNFGISQARGKYIARLDHDDICYPDRFQKQYDYMESHPEVVLCGAWIDFLENGNIIKKKCPEIVGPKELAFSLGFSNYCIAHSSFLIRKSAMVINDIWYGKWQYAEDYDLLVQMLKAGKIDYIRESLVIYRIFPEQCTQTCSNELIQKEEDAIRLKYFAPLDYKDKEILQKAALRMLRTIKEYRQFGYELIKYAGYCGLGANGKMLRDNECIKMIYCNMCTRHQYNCRMLIGYITSPLRDNRWMFSKEGFKFVIKCIIHYRH